MRSFADAEAGGYRADVSLGLGDFFDRAQGRLTLYTQSLDGGYSAPGLQTLTDTENYGGTFQMPVTERLSLRAKVGPPQRRISGSRPARTSSTSPIELNDNWGVATGVRADERSDDSPDRAADAGAGRAHRRRRASRLRLASAAGAPTASCRTRCRSTATARRTAASARAARTGSRSACKIDAEVSNGDLGAGGKIGTNYLHNDRTTLYLNYALENERTDNGLLATRGSEGNTVAGVKTRLSDSTSVYLEERYQNSAFVVGPHALRRASAWRRTERLNLGASTDIGTLRDALTGAETERQAAGFRVGYGFDALQLSSGIEYRSDETEQPDLTFNTRETWLLRNNFKWQLSEASRLLGKLNHSDSVSSLGQFYDGGYTEAVLGYAYPPRASRPVEHAGQVHVLLQRADDGSAHAEQHGRRVHPEEPRRRGRPDLRPHADVVDRRQVRAPPSAS